MRIRSRITAVIFGLLLTSFAVLGLWNASTAEAGKTHVVVIENMKFSPSSVRVPPGDRLTFKNADLVPHTATSKGEKIFDSGPIKPGDSWTLTPPSGRTVRYLCIYHPTMEGEIVAEK